MNSDIILAILIVLIIIILVEARRRYYIVSSSYKFGLQQWAVRYNPDCIEDLTPFICSDLLSEPGNMPTPGRYISSYDIDAVKYAAKVISRFSAFLGPNSNNSLITLTDMRSAKLTLSATDINPFAITWITVDGYSAVVAIRGTLTTQDLMSDLQYSDIVYNSDQSMLVHKGMYEIYQSIKKSLNTTIPDTVKNILIIGHSLGSAIAFYYALDMANSGINVEVYGFAPPRAGNIEFTNSVTSKTRAFSIINMADMIPSAPWSYMPQFKSPYIPVEYSTVLPAIVFNIQLSDIGSCHSMPAYYAGITSDSMSFLPAPNIIKPDNNMPI